MNASLTGCSTPPLWHTKAVGGRPHGVIAGASRPDAVTLWKLVAVRRFDESTGSRPEAGPKHLTENSHGRIYRPRRVDERDRRFYSARRQTRLARQVRVRSEGRSYLAAQACPCRQARGLRDGTAVSLGLPRFGGRLGDLAEQG